MPDANVTTQANLSSDKVAFLMKKRMLRIADITAVLNKLGDKESIPENQGDTVKFVRYGRLGLPLRALTDGVTPAGRKLTVGEVSKQISQFGDYVTLTDQGMILLSHKPFQRAQDRVGEMWGRLVDREIQRELDSATQLYFPNGRADRTLLVAGDVIGPGDFQFMVANLRQTGAPAHTGQFYACVVDPLLEQDIIDAPKFTEVAKYQNMQALIDAEIGRFAGVIFFRTNHFPVVQRDTTVNATVTAENVAGSETALGNGVYTVLVTGLDDNGFEISIGTTTTATPAGAVQLVQVVLPAFPTGIVAFNVYMSGAGGGAAGMTLQLLAEETAGSTVRISGNGAANGANVAVAYSASGAPAPLVPAVGVVVHKGFVFGQEYYATLTLGSMEPMITPGGPSDSDPLGQRRKVGFKGWIAALIENNQFGWKFECASNYDAAS